MRIPINKRGNTRPYIQSHRLLIAAVGLLLSGSGSAQEGFSLAGGIGAARSMPIKLGIQTQFKKRWGKGSTWPIEGYWEGSFYKVKSYKNGVPEQSRVLNLGTVACVFRFQRAAPVLLGWPYVELGVGLGLLTQNEIGGRKLGTRFQFEDRFGLGFKMGENKAWDIGYKAIHFSNAHIGSINHGINLHLFMIGYWF